MLKLVEGEAHSRDDEASPAAAKGDVPATYPEDFGGDRFVPMREVMSVLGFRTSDSVYALAKRKKNPLKLIRLNSRVAGVRVSELRRFLRKLEDTKRA